MNETTYYHGTSTAVCPIGTLYCVPPVDSGKIQEKGRLKNLDRVFFTKDIKSAGIYGGRSRSRFGGSSIVYRLIPMGEVTEHNANEGTSVFSAPWGFFEEIGGNHDK